MNDLLNTVESQKMISKNAAYWSFITQLIIVFTITTEYSYAHLLQPTNKHIIYGAL